jgi:hypothetical protein
MTSQLITIHPYYTTTGEWVFDDPSTGLIKEELVFGIDTMLDTMANIRGLDKTKGFDVAFSSTAMPDYDVKLTKRQEIDGNGKLYGTMYYCEEYGIEGWLCPSLYLYFTAAPDSIYIKVQA